MAREVTDAVQWFVRFQVLQRLAEPGENDVSVSKRLGITKQHVGAIKKSDRGIGLKTAMGMAKALGMEFSEFEAQAEKAYRAGVKSGRISPRSGVKGTVGQHPEWKGVVAEAKASNRKHIPDWAFDRAGETSGAALPEHLSVSFVTDLAFFWWEHSSDPALMEADTESARREMEEEDRRP